MAFSAVKREDDAFIYSKSRKNTIICVLFSMLLYMITSPVCYGEELYDVIEGQLDFLDLSQLDVFIKAMDEDVQSIMPTFDVRDYIKNKGPGLLPPLNPRKLVNTSIRVSLKEILINSRLLGELILLAVLYGVLEHLSSAFEHEGTSTLAYMVSYLALIAIAIRSLMECLKIGQTTIENMVVFMYSLIPVMLSLLVATGGIASAAIFTPITLFLTNGIGTMINTIIFPMIFLSSILAIVSNISDKVQVSRVSKLIDQVVMLLLGLVFTIFTGIVGIYGLATPLKDGIPLRLGKFIAGAFVPIVGSFLTEAVTVAAGGALVIKSALGVLGASAILLTCLFPAIKIMVVVFIHRLAAALIQPISNSKLVEALTALGNSLTRIFAAMVIVAMMFFICIMVIVGMGSMITMVR